MRRNDRWTVPEVEEYLRRCPQALAHKILGLSPATVTERVRTGAWPTVGKSKLDIFAIGELERKRLRAGPVSLQAERLQKAKADSAELINAERRRDLIPYVEAAQVVAELAGAAVQAFDNLGPRLAPMAAEETDPRAIIHAFQTEADNLRRDLAAHCARLEALGPGGEHTEAGARPEPRQVGRRKSRVPKRKRGSRKVSK